MCAQIILPILNIYEYYKDIKGIISIFMVLLTGKSEYLYDVIFIDIKKIMEDNGINIKIYLKNLCWILKMVG